MAGIRYSRTGYSFWKRVLERDYELHKGRRALAAIARDADVDPLKLARWVRDNMAPPGDAGVRIARVVEMPSDEFYALLSDGQVAVSSGSVTPEELTSPRSHPQGSPTQARRDAA